MIGTTFVILAVLTGHTFNVPADKRPPARVFVYTVQASSGVASEEEQGRLASVGDLQDLLAHRKSDFTVVTSEDEAEVIVEVLNREEREAPQGGFGGASVTRFRQTIVRLRVKSGEKQSELKGIGGPSWTSAAKDAAERLTKWTRNR